MKHPAVVLRSPDGRTSATLHPSYGGLVSSLIMPWKGAPREWLYRRPQFWETVLDGGGLPFLFPVCGRHRIDDRAGAYRWNNVEYTMPLHGFSLHHPWAVESADMAQATIVLASNHQTRDCYPFEFEVKLSFSVENGLFRCRQVYSNKGSDPMPFFAGFHPYFDIPEPGVEQVTVEGRMATQGTYNATYTGIAGWQAASSPVNAAVAARGSHVFRLEDDASPALLAFALQHQRFLTMQLAGEATDLPFRYVQFYRSGHDPFVCVEPWMGLPNGLNHPESILTLSPGETRHALFQLRAE